MFGKTNEYYFGTEIILDLGNNIKLECGMKNYLVETVRHLRFNVSSVEYLFGLKIGDIGFQTFCKHYLIPEFNKDSNDRIYSIPQEINQYNPKFRFYFDIEQKIYNL
jgi:hypothetical protein